MGTPDTLTGPAGLVLNREARTVELNGTLLPLSAGEFELLETLMMSRGRVVPDQEMARDASGRHTIAAQPAPCTVIDHLEGVLAEAGAPGLINVLRDVGLVIGAAPSSSSAQPSANAVAPADAFKRARHGAASGCGGCGSAAQSSDLSLPIGSSNIGGLPFALVQGDERVQAHLRYWSDGDRSRIHQAIVIAMKSGHATLRNVRWMGGVTAATLDIELTRVDHPHGPRLVCDVIPVRGSTPPSDLGPW